MSVYMDVIEYLVGKYGDPVAFHSMDKDYSLNLKSGGEDLRHWYDYDESGHARLTIISEVTKYPQDANTPLIYHDVWFDDGGHHSRMRDVRDIKGRWGGSSRQVSLSYYGGPLGSFSVHFDERGGMRWEDDTVEAIEKQEFWETGDMSLPNVDRQSRKYPGGERAMRRKMQSVMTSLMGVNWSLDTQRKSRTINDYKKCRPYAPKKGCRTPKSMSHFLRWAMSLYCKYGGPKYDASDAFIGGRRHEVILDMGQNYGVRILINEDFFGDYGEDAEPTRYVEVEVTYMYLQILEVHVSMEGAVIWAHVHGDRTYADPNEFKYYPGGLDGFEEYLDSVASGFRGAKPRKCSRLRSMPVY